MRVVGEENAKKQGVSQGCKGRAKLGSNLGPITAENLLKLGPVTQNQAKRINEIALRWLLRDKRFFFHRRIESRKQKSHAGVSATDGFRGPGCADWRLPLSNARASPVYIKPLVPI
jgi:hypothetical protein